MKVKKNNKALNWKRLVSVLCCIVVFCTTYALILPAVTLSKDTYCGKEAHTHDAECYREHDKSKPLCDLEEGESSEGHVHDASCYQTQEVGRTLICGLEEDGEHVHSDDCYETQVETVLVCGKEEGSGATEGHVHNEDCYMSETPICGQEEHEHNHECYSNKEDVEDPKDWEEAYKDINKEEDAKTRILTVAKNEVGYKENEANFSVDENDAEHYYTRYGHLYEDMYGDWNNYFTGYVLKYANVKMNFDKDISKWQNKTIDDQKEEGEEGNVVFFRDDEGELRSGIVTKVDDLTKEIRVIEGDVDGQLKEERVNKDKVIAYLSDEVTIKDEDTPLAGDGVEKEEDNTLENNKDSNVNTSHENEDGISIQTYQDDDIEVIASYPSSANIPENAQFKVTYMGSANEFSFTYDVGFYIGDEEIEPEDVVNIKFKFLDGRFTKSEKLNITHFKKNGEIEILNDKFKVSIDGLAESEFEMTSFSPVTIEEAVEEKNIIISKGITETYSYPSGFENANYTVSDTSIIDVTKANGGIQITGKLAGPSTITFEKNGSHYRYYVEVTDTDSYTLTFANSEGEFGVGNKNNLPAPITKRGGSYITLPKPTETTIKKNGKTYVFKGWTRNKNYNDNYTNPGVANYMDAVYLAGNQNYLLNQDDILYPIYALQIPENESGNNPLMVGHFFIKLNGQPVSEPNNDSQSNKGNYTDSRGNDYYSISKKGNWDVERGIEIADAIKEFNFAASASGLGEEYFNKMPTNEDIKNAVNNAQVKDENNQRVYLMVDQNGKLYRANQRGESTGVEAEVRWYVIKPTHGYGRDTYKEGIYQCNIDGVLLFKDKVVLTYDPNVPNPTQVDNVPAGASLKKDTKVIVGRSANGNETAIPTRIGYNFLGWSRNKNATVPEFPGDGIDKTSNTFNITEDTILYAIWGRSLNTLTINKKDYNGSALIGASFRLEEKKEGNTEFIPISEEFVTQQNGSFVYTNMQNMSIYHLIETNATDGNDTNRDFYFMVHFDDDSQVSDFWITDENGNKLDSYPSWITISSYDPNAAKVNIDLGIEDSIIARKVEFYKGKKESNDFSPLSGAEYKLELIECADNNYKLSGDELLAKSNADGLFSKTDLTLPLGKYQLTEITAPNGFNIHEPIEFELKLDAEGKEIISVDNKYNDFVTIETTSSQEIIGTVTKTTNKFKVKITDYPTIKVNLKKVSNIDSNKVLDGAEFELYKLDSKDEVLNSEKILQTKTTGENGVIDFGALKNGYYALKETKAPAGYNLLENEIRFEVKNDSTGSSVTVLNGENNGTKPDVIMNQESGIYEITVTNNAGESLPNTGGAGTKLFTFSGAAVIAASGLMYGYKKKKDKRNGKGGLRK